MTDAEVETQMLAAFDKLPRLESSDISKWVAKIQSLNVRLKLAEKRVR